VRWLVVAVALVACGKSAPKKRADAGPGFEPIKVPVFGDAGPTGAADEVEPNDNPDTATALPLGGSVHGRIDPADTDADYYRIDVASAGALAVEVSAVDKTDLALELLDGAGNVVAKSDRGGAKVKEGFPNFGVQPGRYTLVVRGKKVPAKQPPRPKKGPPAPAGPPVAVLPYDITAKVTPFAANAEREPDDDRGTANDLIVGDSMSGYIGWTGDVDVWKLSVEALSAKNSIDVEIGGVDGVAFSLELADGVGAPLVVRKAPRGAALTVRNLVPNVPAGAPPYHYLTIKASPSNPDTPYTLRVTAKNPEPDAEIEPNDSDAKAMALTDRTQITAHWSPGDTDCFAIPPDPAQRNVSIDVTPPAEADLAVEVAIDGKVVGRSDVKGKGAREQLVVPVPGNARAIVRVHGNDAGNEGSYTLKVTDRPDP
jgi:hypothetical protein